MDTTRRYLIGKKGGNVVVKERIDQSPALLTSIRR